MALSREYLAYLAPQLAARLGKSGKVSITNLPAVAGKVQTLIQEDFAKEERLNQEVRNYLEQYNERIRREGISYQEMYTMVKKELLKKYSLIPSGGSDREGGKLSRSKVMELSHLLVKELARLRPHIEFLQESNEVRLEIVRQLQALLKEESQIEQAAQQKIRSQKREIEEGSAEWDILFRKYYTEEMRKLGAA